MAEKKIEAVSMNRLLCLSGDMNVRTGVMSVYHPSGGVITLDEVYYALLSADKTSYERIEVEKMITSKSVKLKCPIKGSFSPNLPIGRIVYGIVQNDGEYLLRVRNEGADTRYLVRYEVGEEERFQVVDFHDQEVLQ